MSAPFCGFFLEADGLMKRRHVDQIALWRKTDRTTPRPSTRACGAVRREISATLVSAINPNAVMAD
jgi:hypothetical protein